MEGTGTIGRYLMNSFLVRGGTICVIHAATVKPITRLCSPGEALRALILDSLEAQVEAQIKYVKGLIRDRDKQNARPANYRGLAV